LKTTDSEWRTSTSLYILHPELQVLMLRCQSKRIAVQRWFNKFQRFSAAHNPVRRLPLPFTPLKQGLVSTFAFVILRSLALFCLGPAKDFTSVYRRSHLLSNLSSSYFLFLRLVRWKLTRFQSTLVLTCTVGYPVVTIVLGYRSAPSPTCENKSPA